MYRKLILTLLSLICLSLTLMAAAEAEETILAEYEGGKITEADLEARIEQIPGMYRHKFQTTQGKQRLLDMMAVEEIFLDKAFELGLNEDEEVLNRIDTQMKSYYANEFSQNEINDNIEFTRQEKQDYFTENIDKFKGKTFTEAEPQIERMLRPEKQKEMKENLINDLKEEYEVTIHEDVINKIELDNIEKNLEFGDELIVSSGKDKDLEKTVEDFVELYEILNNRQRASLQRNGLVKFIDSLTEQDLFYFKALEEDYDEKESIQKRLRQVERTIILRTAYNQLVVNKIDTGEAKQKEYYEKNIELFSSQPSRKIQAFCFKTKEDAEKYQDDIVDLVKADKIEEVNSIVQEHCVYTKDNGIIEHIYKNGIVPGYGKDQKFSQVIWNTNPDEVSEIFKNSDDEYTFVRIVEDIKAKPQPFEAVSDKIVKRMRSELGKAKFEELKEEMKEEYSLKTYPDKLVKKLTAKEYFDKASNAQKNHRFHDAISYYDKIIEYYPNNEDDYKALFMKGFLYSEDMKNKEKAKECFTELLNSYPEGELHESAEYMIDELTGKNTTIENLEE